MKNWPRRIKIKARWWDIVYLENDDPAMGDPEPLLGWCDETVRTIAINKLQSASTMRDTLVHELMHAYYATMPGKKIGYWARQRRSSRSWTGLELVGGSRAC